MKKKVKAKVEELENNIYVPEKILDNAEIDGVMHFQVKWVGYDKPEDYTWEPLQNLMNCTKMIETYMETKKETKKEENSNLITTSFLVAQKYPHAFIKIEPKKQKEHRNSPFAFRKRPKSSSTATCIRKISKSDDKTLVIFDNGESMSYDNALLLFPSALLQYLHNSTKVLETL